LQMDIDRRVVETAHEYMADEEGGVGFVYSGFAQAALPHKKIADDAVWQIQTERVMLLVEPGRRAVRDGVPIPIGVPYGSRARLIMLYLMGRALETGSREVELGRSLRDWLVRMGIPQGGKSIRDVREQAERISRCRLSFQIQQGGRTGLVNQNIVDSAIFLDSSDPDQGNLFLERAKLSESFFEQLQRHPVPIEEAAISSHQWALDGLGSLLLARLPATCAPRRTPRLVACSKGAVRNGFYQNGSLSANFPRKPCASSCSLSRRRSRYDGARSDITPLPATSCA
jgi:hypothetical protein